MPGEDVLYDEDYGVRDIFPNSEEEQIKVLGWVLEAFNSADSAKRDYERKWLRADKLYHSQMRRKAGDWRSKLFIPYIFSTIESITPMMLAESPKMVVTGVRPEDVDPAKLLESRLNWCIQQSCPTFSIELLKAQKSALKYGTGILKNFHVKDERTYYKSEPVMQPVMMDQPIMDSETGFPAEDIEGGPMSEQVPAVDPMTGQPMMQQAVDPQTGQPQYQMVPRSFVYYDGPASKYVDILDFFPAPEALDIEDARYVIHRLMKDTYEIQQKMQEGLYRMPDGLPEGISVDDVYSAEDFGIQKRLKQLGLSGGEDTTKRKAELLECWTRALPGYEGRIVVVTVLNRRAVIRMQENPFWHGEYPFSRFVDYLQEGDFWGKGEIEALEGLQDFANAITNQRIDNVRLALDKQVVYNAEAIEDENELSSVPGGKIRVKTGIDPRAAVFPFEYNDITGSAYMEADYAERQIERTSGVTPMQTGLASEAYQDTATAAALMQEAGNTKFAMKLKLMENVGLTPLARQWGSIIQQFTTEEQAVQAFGPAGQMVYETLTPDNVQGAMAYSIKSQSTAMTQATRLEGAMRRLQTIATYWPVATPRLVQDVLEAEDIVNTAEYMTGSMGLLSTLAMLTLQQQGIPQLTQMALTGQAPPQPGEEQAAEEEQPY